MPRLRTASGGSVVVARSLSTLGFSAAGGATAGGRLQPPMTLRRTRAIFQRQRTGLKLRIGAPEQRRSRRGARALRPGSQLYVNKRRGRTRQPALHFSKTG